MRGSRREKKEVGVGEGQWSRRERVGVRGRRKEKKGVGRSRIEEKGARASRRDKKLVG